MNTKNFTGRLYVYKDISFAVSDFDSIRIFFDSIRIYGILNIQSVLIKIAILLTNNLTRFGKFNLMFKNYLAS